MPHPPTLIRRFFRWFCHPELLKYIEGDLMELYRERLADRGKRYADLKFIADVMLLFRPGIIRPVSVYKRNENYYGMYKSYFKIGWRNLLKNKGYSIINIGGLAAGMAVAMLISLWIYDELSYNRFHENYDTIAKVYRKENWGKETGVNYIHVTGLGTLLRSEYPSHFKRVVMVRANVEERVISLGDKKFTQNGYFMQPDGGEMFSLKMRYGVRDGLKDMKSILLSESLSKKLFGDTDPVNQVVSMDARWDLKVTGVYEDLPDNSEFSGAAYFAPLDLYLEGASLTAWDNYHMYIYVQVQDAERMDDISSMIRYVTLPHLDEETARIKPETFLLPMSKWHLFSEYKNGVPVTSARLMSVWYYGTIGVFVLLLACINFMNLSTARSERRAKEVGIRKSIGSQRGQLIQQFYGESMLVSILAFLISILVVQVSLPWFNEVSDKAIQLPWQNPVFWLTCLGFTFFTGLLAGSYPALYLSSFKPVKVLKGTFRAGSLAALPRKILVVTQFTVSIVLIIGTVTIYRQIQFAKNRPVGYSPEGLISLRTASPEYRGKYQLLRDELKATGAVEEIAESNYSVISTKGWNGGFSWKGEKIDASFNTIFVTHEYGKTVGWEFTDGRDFSREISSDISGIVINESALEMLNLENPVGEELRWAPGGSERGTYKILGVVKDMIKGSPYEKTFPSIIFLSENDMQWLYIRIRPDVSTHAAIPKIQQVFSRLVPSAAFDVTFAEDAYRAKFREEERIGKLGTLFSVLAILISCLGLFGLSSFVAEQRTKEIGIRKILGASVISVWRMLSRDFVLLVVVACFLAIPLSFYVMNGWLLNYEYHTSIPWYLYGLSGLGALSLTLLTISYQAIKAATQNPAESLRSE